MELLGECDFPPAGTAVDLAVSGGADSLGLVLLALDAGLVVHVHHVDHHARPTSTEDATFVRGVCEDLGVECVVHDVVVESGPNFEARARAARRGALPVGAMTAHTMDDLAETVLLRLMRGAGLDGLSPMVGDPTKPLLGVRREDLARLVAARGLLARQDETNLSPDFSRNRVRHEVLPLLDDVARRDVVPLLARSAQVLASERVWRTEVGATDLEVALGDADCRELREWTPARLAYWLRVRLASPGPGGETYPPSAEEIERAVAVVRGEAVACELSGGRRLSRRAQRLALSGVDA